MEILQYSEGHHQFRKRLREFCRKEIIPNIGRWEKDHLVPKEIWEKMGKEGFLCTWVSPRYGGLGLDFLYSVIVAEEMTKTNHYGLDSFLHSDIVVPYIGSFGTEEQKRRYLPDCVSGKTVTAIAMTEPDAGSDLAAMISTAKETADGIVLNGS
ncbi:MAG: acyl-CoA dehydrogenase family protein, partial [Pseudomonadota bacterium]